MKTASAVAVWFRVQSSVPFLGGLACLLDHVPPSLEAPTTCSVCRIMSSGMRCARGPVGLWPGYKCSGVHDLLHLIRFDRSYPGRTLPVRLHVGTQSALHSSERLLVGSVNIERCSL